MRGVETFIEAVLVEVLSEQKPNKERNLNQMPKKANPKKSELTSRTISKTTTGTKSNAQSKKGAAVRGKDKKKS